MIDLTKEKAWVIFRADKLGHIEGKAAVDALSKEEFDAYECYAEDFELELAKIGVEAQNEAAAIWEEYPTTKAVLESIKPYNWTTDEYGELLEVFRGSKFEKLHLSAMFRVNNAELLLELVKP
jgi:hypothetical protein